MRTKNKTDKIKDVKGLTEKCKVCYQNNRKIFINANMHVFAMNVYN